MNLLKCSQRRNTLLGQEEAQAESPTLLWGNDY